MHLLDERNPIPQSTSARITKWALLLMGYSYSISYSKGQDIPHADALTRLKYNYVETDNDDKRVNDVLFANHAQFASPLLEVSRIKNELQCEPLLQNIIRRVTDGNWADCSQAERAFATVSEKLTMENGLLYHRSRLFIPTRLRLEAFQHCHNDVLRSTLNLSADADDRCVAFCDYVS